MAQVSVTFGTTQQWVVPTGVYLVTIEVWGARGYGTYPSEPGGLGGYAKGDLYVSPGEVLHVYVQNNGGLGRWQGGGSTDVRRGGTALSNRVIVAGGGGGGGAAIGRGGSGRYPSGGSGSGDILAEGGGGGTQSAGGAGGDGDSSYYDGSPGQLGAGGNGGRTSASSRGGGGGGGGYYGGGGGGATIITDPVYGGGGGGGSSYIGGVFNASTQNGVHDSTSGQAVITYIDNTAPYAPTRVAPADGAALDWQQNQIFDWLFNDPDPGDSQSAYNWAYRPTGAPVWTETGWVTSTSTQRTIPGGTFDAGDYEWRVRTKDAQGEESPWSSTGFFTAADAPPGPTITDPVNGGTVPTDEYPVVWSTPDQDAYQLQVLDEAETVLSDTGQVDQPTARSRLVLFPDNQTTRSIQVRVLYGGLWSPWSTVTVTVSYTPPPVPWVTATPVDVGAGVLSAIRVDVDDPRLRVDARNLVTNPSGEATSGTIPYPYSTEVLDSGPVGYWRLGEASGTVAVDSSGNGHDLTYQGTPTFGVPGGIADDDTAVTFLGNSYATGPDFRTVFAEGSFECWVDTSTWVDGTAYGLFQNNTSGIGGTVNYVGLRRLADGRFEYTVRASDSASYGFISQWRNYFGTVDGWHHLVATWNASTMTLYVDGVSVATRNCVPPDGPASLNPALQIARNPDVPGNGETLDEAALYERALTAAEVAEHYEVGAGAVNVPVPVGWSNAYYDTTRERIAALPGGATTTLPTDPGPSTLVVETETGTLRTPHTGTVVTVTEPYFRAAVVPGTYTGPYFDGDTPADGIYTYRWTGIPDASTSERLAYGTSGELAESTEPLVVAHDVWVRGGPEGEIRLAADLPASLPYLWHLPASGVEYEFRARAVGDNGTSSWSEWVA